MSAKSGQILYCARVAKLGNLTSAELSNGEESPGLEHGIIFNWMKCAYLACQGLA